MKKVKNSRANRKSKTGDLADQVAEHILSTNDFSIEIAKTMEKSQPAIKEAARRILHTARNTEFVIGSSELKKKWSDWKYEYIHVS